MRAVVFGFLSPLNDLSCCVVRCSQYGTHKQKTQMLNEIRKMPKAPALRFIASLSAPAMYSGARHVQALRKKESEDKKDSIGFRVFDGVCSLSTFSSVAVVVDLFSPDQMESKSCSQLGQTRNVSVTDTQ